MEGLELTSEKFAKIETELLKAVLSCSSTEVCARVCVCVGDVIVCMFTSI